MSREAELLEHYTHVHQTSGTTGPRVVPVGPGVLPRTEGKARRVTDLRGSAVR